MKLKQSLLVLSLIVLGVLVSACGGTTATPTVISVSIDQNDLTLGVGQTSTLTTTVDVTGGAATSVNWLSSDDTVATVDADGVVTAVAVGTATITATSTADATKQDTVEVTVTAEAQVVVAIDQADFSLTVGGTQQLSATVTGNADTSVTWLSSDENVATVDADGVVTAVAAGTATITATSVADPNKSDSVEVTVTNPTTPAVNSVTINEGDKTINVGGTTTFTVTVDAAGGADESVTWASDNEAVAMVDQNGVVTGVSDGSAVITATSTFDPTKSDSVNVTVSTAVTTPGNFPVLDGNDDAEQFIEQAANASFPLNSTSTASSDLDITNDVNGNRGNQLVGLRFQNVTIPQGAIVTSAYIQFTADISTSGAVNFTIEGQAADDAAAFVDYPANNAASLNNISSRTRTTTQVPWAPAAWVAGEAGINQQTADISAVVQEIVNRAGWTSGNALAVILSGPNSDVLNETRVAKAFEKGAALAPVLVVEYQ